MFEYDLQFLIWNDTFWSDFRGFEMVKRNRGYPYQDQDFIVDIQMKTASMTQAMV